MHLVNEIFTSINGEGIKAGQMADFIRLAGCPLNCSYCDTTYAQQHTSGVSMTTEAVLERIESSGAQLVTITGGEPLCSENIEVLINEILSQTEKWVEIETSGAVPLREIQASRKQSKLSVTIDYKLPSSRMNDKMVQDNYKQLKPWDVVKYVVMTQEDLIAVKNHFETYMTHYDFDLAPRAILSPVYGKMVASSLVTWLLNEAKSNQIYGKMGVQLQLHKYIWNPNERGV